MNTLVKIGIIIAVIPVIVYIGLPLYNGFLTYYGNEYSLNKQLERFMKLSCNDEKSFIALDGYPPTGENPMGNLMAFPGVEKRIFDSYETKCGKYVPPDGKTQGPLIWKNKLQISFIFPWCRNYADCSHISFS